MRGPKDILSNGEHRSSVAELKERYGRKSVKEIEWVAVAWPPVDMATFSTESDEFKAGAINRYYASSWYGFKIQSFNTQASC